MTPKEATDCQLALLEPFNLEPLNRLAVFASSRKEKERGERRRKRKGGRARERAAGPSANADEGYAGPASLHSPASVSPKQDDLSPRVSTDGAGNRVRECTDKGSLGGKLGTKQGSRGSEEEDPTISAFLVPDNLLCRSLRRHFRSTKHASYMKSSKMAPQTCVCKTAAYRQPSLRQIAARSPTSPAAGQPQSCTQSPDPLRAS
jgi:hypothetical protein